MNGCNNRTAVLSLLPSAFCPLPSAFSYSIQILAIALAASAGDTNQQQVIAAGFQKHISKPIELEELVQAIAQLVHSTWLRVTQT